MGEHRVATKRDPAVDAHAFVARRRTRECDTGVRGMPAHTRESPEEIEMPPRAAQLAVGHCAQADGLLTRDHPRNLTILDERERGRIDVATREPCSRLHERRWPQQTANVIGAKRCALPAHRGHPSRKMRMAQPSGMRGNAPIHSGGRQS